MIRLFKSKFVSLFIILLLSASCSSFYGTSCKVKECCKKEKECEDKKQCPLERKEKKGDCEE